MEFHEKLQTIRKQKGLTQEELAQALFVSRTAISKWESGRGYPSIDSLKAIAKYFSLSLDALLSGEELLTIAEADSKQKQSHLQDLVFGLLDCSSALLFFLPFFGQKTDSIVQAVSLLKLSHNLKSDYCILTVATILWGVVSLSAQNCKNALWQRIKHKISLILTGIGALLFIISLQPYAAIFLFVFLCFKVFMLLKGQ